MLILKNNVKVELFVKNSQFIAEGTSINSPEEAREHIAKQKHLYPDATHIVYAFIVGPQGNIMGCSDAGEPSGTSGPPTLAVLKGSNITNMIITTARWFGGTKLGTGGLVQAYSECAKAVIENAVTTELIPLKFLEFACPYNLYEQIKRVLTASNFEIAEELFTDEIKITGNINELKYDNLKLQISNLSNGKIQI